MLKLSIKAYPKVYEKQQISYVGNCSACNQAIKWGTGFSDIRKTGLKVFHFSCLRNKLYEDVKILETS